MQNDPIVADVRRIREEIVREAGFDMHKLFERQKRVLKEWRSKQDRAGRLAVAETCATYGNSNSGQ